MVNTLKQFIGNLPKNYFSVFNHFVGLAFKELIEKIHIMCELPWKSKVYSEPSQKSKMELLVKLVNGFQLRITLAKKLVLDVWLGF